MWIIDPLDGSSLRNRELPEWAVSVAPKRNGVHLGGAIISPQVLHEFAVIGERGQGVTFREGGLIQIAPSISARPRKESIVFIGHDIHFLPQFIYFIFEVAPQIQTMSSTNCAIALAFIVAGKIDALVQPVQGPWDWAAGYPLVEEVGGKFQFYHYRDGEVVALPKPDAESYDPVYRKAAFIAGEPHLVDWLFEVLRQKWRRC